MEPLKNNRPQPSEPKHKSSTLLLSRLRLSVRLDCNRLGLFLVIRRRSFKSSGVIMRAPLPAEILSRE